MKCLIIHGSYRKGNTYRVTEIIKERMNQLGGIEFDEVFLSKVNMQFCAGCNRCFLEGEEYCPHKDIIQPLAWKIADADALIITTPTYSLHLSSLVKCFIDHMSYNFHRPSYFTKKAMVVGTTVGAGVGTATKYIGSVLKHWGFNRVYKINLKCVSLDYKPKEKELKYIEKNTDKFYSDIKSKKLYSPTIKSIFFFNLWRAVTALGKKENSLDYRYWHETKMDNMIFAEGIPVGVFKKIFGKLIFRLLKNSMAKLGNASKDV